MNSRLVYLAEPIDSIRDAGAIAALRDEAIEHAQQEAMVLFMPSRAFAGTGHAAPDPSVGQICWAAFDYCVALIALWPVGVPSTGVPMEIERARARGIPCAVVRPAGIGDSWSMAELAGDGRCAVVHSVAAAFQWVSVQLLQTSGRSHRTMRVAGPGWVPRRAHAGDAGYDLHYHGDAALRVEPGDHVYVSAGIHLQMPDGMWAMVVGRSSAYNRGLLVNTAIIDAGYRGEIGAHVRNIGHSDQKIAVGERVAQLVPMPLLGGWPGLEVRQVAMEDLGPSSRGDRGYGSTGR